MKRFNYLRIILIFIGGLGYAYAQEMADTITVSNLTINKKKQEVFSGRDSSLMLLVDTLIMKDRARLLFYGKKDIVLKVKHAVIGKNAMISATDGKNNGADMDIYMDIQSLKRLLIDAGGRDAFNGTKTYPNGDGGDVHFYYEKEGVAPQQTDDKQDRYLFINTRAGGYSVNAQSDIRNILGRIGQGSRPLGQLPQGQVYSGSPGIDGKSTVEVVASF